jgi:hypothetical protein
VDSNGQTIWIVDAHRDDGKRFIVRADEKLTAFLELESSIRAATQSLCHARASPHIAGSTIIVEFALA